MQHASRYSHPLTIEDATTIAEIHVCVAASVFTDVFRMEMNRELSNLAAIKIARRDAVKLARDRLMVASDTREYLFARLLRAKRGAA